MELYDLTHCIRNGMPVYPGTPPLSLSCANTLERDGFRETHFSMASHTGTHMDAPAHMCPEGRTLDQMRLADFCGDAYVLPCAGLESIGVELLKTVPALEKLSFLLLCSGHDALWGTPAYFKDFPVLTPEAARYLAALPLKGIGMDMMSADPIEDESYTNHHILFAAGKVIVENLRGLSALKGESVCFAAFPLYYKDADGAPVRAAARRMGR